MGCFNKYLFLGSFFLFSAVASVDYIYLRAGRVRPGGEVVNANLVLFARGAVGGSKQIGTKKWGGQSKLFFFSIIFVRITFFSNGRVRQERGMIQAI